ncbi:KGG domain-containing protein [Alteribacillus sp. YIM 98480]|uniref:KGG domain-containing protein n=1 Tax=Alteribacillus sp. YIM 98480 TaxID=2606599 RepID=UPI00131CA69D|nr:KGG domain-containing protein [Alteribacillus sp. YIM 98480]
MANKNNENRKMTVNEAGRIGGETTSEKHDREFYQDIGQKGGETTSKEHDKEFYKDIGQKGGEARSNQNNNSS